MKKIATTLVIIAVIALAYVLLDRPTDRPDFRSGNGGSSAENFRPDPSSATFTFNDGPVTFSNGQATQSIAPGSAFVDDISITGEIAYGDLNGDGRNDAALLILRQGGVSGMFIYVAGLISGSSGSQGTNAILIGDRVAPRSLSIEDGVIKIEYLDRGEDEPLAAEPTVLINKKFVLRSGTLVEM